MKPALSKEIEDKICDVLGLDASMLRSISINLSVDAVPTVSIVSYIDKESIEGLIGVFEEYDLVKREKEDE